MNQLHKGQAEGGSFPGAGLGQADDIGIPCQHPGDGLLLNPGGLFKSELVNGPDDFVFQFERRKIHECFPDKGRGNPRPVLSLKTKNASARLPGVHALFSILNPLVLASDIAIPTGLR
jgi:hypothetical protein